MLMEADLPDDVAALRALVLEQARELDTLKVFRAEVERLKAIIDALQRHRFGRRSEQLDPDQFEDTAEVTLAKVKDSAPQDAADRLVQAAATRLLDELESGAFERSRRDVGESSIVP